MLHSEVLEVLVGGKDVFQEYPQAGDIPLAVAYLKDEAAFRLRGRTLKVR